MLSRIDSRRRGGRFNPYALGLVTEAYKYNQISGDDIYYALKNTNYNIDTYYPIADNKLASYPFLTDAGGYIMPSSTSIGVKTFGATLVNKKNYDSKTGEWTSATNYDYTTQIGATVTFQFEGTGLDIRVLKSSSGGLFNISIDGGAAIPVSCYVYPTAAYYTVQVVRGLQDVVHTVVVTFAGQDPANPVGIPRGYVCYSTDNATYKSFHVYQEGYTYTKETDIQAGPWLQFAIAVKKRGATYSAQFFPSHGNVTTTPIYRSIRVDGVEVSYTKVSTMKTCKKIEIIQQFYTFNSNEPGLNHGIVNAKFTINKYGFYVEYTFSALIDIDIDYYGMMMPWARSFAESLIDSNGQSYPVTQIGGSVTTISNGDTVRSVRLVNNTGSEELKKCCLNAALVTDSVLRLGHSDRGGVMLPNPILFIENRDSTILNKLYCATWRGSTMDAGSSFSAKFVYYIGRKSL